MKITQSPQGLINSEPPKFEHVDVLPFSGQLFLGDFVKVSDKGISRCPVFDATHYVISNGVVDGKVYLLPRNQWDQTVTVGK